MQKLKTRWLVLDRIVEHVVATGSTPTPGQVVRMFNGELAPSTVRSAILSLIDDGYIRQLKGHGAPLRPLVDSDGVRIEIEARRVHP